MPHDLKGRLIEKGDVIKVQALNHPFKVVGTVRAMVESQSCSGQVAFQVIGGVKEDYFNASDAELILKADGTEPSEGPTVAAEAPAEVPAPEAPVVPAEGEKKEG